MPVVLFSWTYDFDRWPTGRFSDYQTYGNIKWDTHIYTGGFDNLDAVLAVYDY